MEPKVCIALGGGAARGLAHLGVLKILEDAHIPIHLVAGTSLGALIGGLYAAQPDAAYWMGRVTVRAVSGPADAARVHPARRAAETASAGFSDIANMIRRFFWGVGHEARVHLQTDMPTSSTH
jgi:predicted acylesterase/phospholipase RssA